jgi:hypothetical protein
LCRLCWCASINKPLASCCAQGKKLFFVTNNSTKSRAGYLKKFTSLGLKIKAVRSSQTLDTCTLLATGAFAACPQPELMHAYQDNKALQWNLEVHRLLGGAFMWYCGVCNATHRRRSTLPPMQQRPTLSPSSLTRRCMSLERRAFSRCVPQWRQHVATAGSMQNNSYRTSTSLPCTINYSSLKHACSDHRRQWLPP